MIMEHMLGMKLMMMISLTGESWYCYNHTNIIVHSLLVSPPRLYC